MPVADRPPPMLAAVTHGLPLGGSTTFLLNFARARIAKGETLPIITTSEMNELREDFAAIGAEVDTIRTKGRIYEDRLADAYDHLASHQPRAVLACLSSESFEMLRLAPPGVVRLGIIQSDDPAPYQMARQYAPWLDAMVGVSSEICQRLRAIPEFGTTRIAHIPYGIAFPAFQPRQHVVPDSPLRLVYMGRIVEEQKRVSRLATLAQLLAERSANVELSIIGAGPDEFALRTAFGNNPIVRWRGALRPRDVMSFLAKQDVFLLLSDYEGLPLSLLEAMAAGLVPIVSDLPSGMREVVSDEIGFRVPIGDVAAATEAVLELERDRGRWRQLSERGSARARADYSAERMNRQFEALIAEFPATRDIHWPSVVQIPVPLGLLHDWVFQGLPRITRRAIRRIFG